MKLIILVISTTLLLSACSQQKEKSHEPTEQEMKHRNDTSNHSTDIGNNKTY